MRQLLRVLLGASIAVAVTACQRGTSTVGDGLSGGRLVYEESFEGSGLPKEWTTASKAWRVAGGMLHGERAENEGVWLQVPLPDKVRVTFKAASASDDGDLKFEVFTDGRTHQSGYVGIFGGWKNSLNIIARLDEHGSDRLVGAEGQKVVKDRVYEMAVVRTDSRVRWYVDGKPFLTYHDGKPLEGEGHRHFGFNDWHVPVRFDDVKVYDLGAP
jgi:hypothetical protein